MSHILWFKVSTSRGHNPTIVNSWTCRRRTLHKKLNNKTSCTWIQLWRWTSILYHLFDKNVMYNEKREPVAQSAIIFICNISYIFSNVSSCKRFQFFFKKHFFIVIKRKDGCSFFSLCHIQCNYKCSALECCDQRDRVHFGFILR